MKYKRHAQWILDYAIGSKVNGVLKPVDGFGRSIAARRVLKKHDG